MKRINIEKLENNIEQIALYDLGKNNVFGCSYMVCQNGETVFKKHFGVSDWEKKTPVDDNTLFRIGSMTKPIVTAGILNLVDRYVISLDTPIKSVLPKFHNIHIKSEKGEDLGVSKIDMTIKHILTHTSGFGSLKEVNMTNVEKLTATKTVEHFLKKGLDFEPFSKEAYSTFASFDILALVLERVTGENFGDFIKREIFEPCKMNNTTFVPTENEWSRIIDMHNRKKGNSGKNTVFKMPEGCIFEDFSATHKLAGAGLVSTLEDYSHFAEMLLNKVKTNRIFALMNRPYKIIDIPPYDQSWGLGVRVISGKNYNYLPVGSFGLSGEYGTHFWCDPKHNITAVYMKNSKFDGGAGNKSACSFEEAVCNAIL